MDAEVVPSPHGIQYGGPFISMYLPTKYMKKKFCGFHIMWPHRACSTSRHASCVSSGRISHHQNEGTMLFVPNCIFCCRASSGHWDKNPHSQPGNTSMSWSLVWLGGDMQRDSNPRQCGAAAHSSKSRSGCVGTNISGINDGGSRRAKAETTPLRRLPPACLAGKTPS